VEIKLVDQFNAANAAVREGVKAGLKAYAFALQSEAMAQLGSHGLHATGPRAGQRYLIDTGAMHRSIYVEADGVDGRDAAIAAALGLSPAAVPGQKGTPIDTSYQARVGVAVHYGVYHEMGTVTMPARPYMGPAAQALKPQADAIVGRAVTDALRMGTP
jgi:HK97 gp10 family phage protein